MILQTIGILPTGTGKSLCYQIATFLQLGISIIICPLKSLLKDQIDSMQSDILVIMKKYLFNKIL